MYVYFDVNGNLKEIINLPVREGSVKANTIYIYVEPVSNPQPVDNIFSLPQRFTNAKINFRDDGGNNINPNGGNSVPMVKLTGEDAVQIPFDPKKDIYFFKYGFKYEMWSVELPSTVTNVNGLVSATAYLYNLSEQLALNTFSFNVEASVGVKPDRTMSEAQYSYLYNKIQFVEEIEESLVPYTNATNDVNLGNHGLRANSVGVYYNGTTSCGGFGSSSNGALYVESDNAVVLEAPHCYVGSASTNNEIATKKDTKLYKHTITITDPGDNHAVTIVTYLKSAQVIETVSDLIGAGVYVDIDEPLSIPLTAYITGDNGIAIYTQIEPNSQYISGYELNGYYIIEGYQSPFQTITFEIYNIYDVIEEVID